MLREASRLFAPLGNPFVTAANQAGCVLDEYFSAVEFYNKDAFSQRIPVRGKPCRRCENRWGRDLDEANHALYGEP